MKKALAALLALVMVLSVFPSNIFTTMVTATEINTGSIIAFGSYPQTKVTDTALISALNSDTPDTDNNVTHDGTKFRKVCFTQYNFGNNYQLANGYLINTVYWFKYEPLLWRVLSNTGGELLVVAENIIDAKVFNADGTNVSWETCQLRTWLNNNFYNIAFSATESSKIITSNIVNQGSSNTSDKMFLLSTSEANNSAYGFGTLASRVSQGTDFSKCGGLMVQTSGSATGKSMWWLRTASGTSSYCVTESGSTSGAYDNTITFIGVRPAYRINLTTSGLKTITFDANGGTGGFSTLVNAGDPLAAPVVTKTGYSFTGWSPAVPATVPSENTTYTAQWGINNYTINFQVDGGSDVAAITQAYNTSVAQPAVPVKPGYDFHGWFLDSGLTNAVSWPYTITNDVTFYAKWNVENHYTITFNANGGSGGISSSLLAGDPLTAPAVTRTGYTLSSWSPSIPATVPSADTTYTAQWTANTYTVTFSTSGGTVSPTSIIVTYGSTYGTLPTPTRAGYTFGGWYTSLILPPFGSGKLITGYTTVTITAAQMLFAKWTANTYTVTFDAQGGTVSPTTATVTYASTYGTLPTPTKANCTFDGWYTSPGGAGTKVISTTSVTITGAQTLYAKWIVLSGPSITFDANGGTGGTSSSMVAGSVLTAPTVTRTGYTFTGWLPVVPATVPSVDTTFTAQWSINSYTVTFNANGGSAVTAITQNYNTTVAKPADPVKTGYTFSGWYSDSSLTAAVTWPYTLTGNVTFYAKWMANSYTITYNGNGFSAGSTADSSHIYDVSANLTLNGFTKTGNTFLGWSTDSGATSAAYTDGQSVINLSSSPSDIITFYAVWANAPADYTQLNALIAQAEGLDRDMYTTDSLTAVDKALSSAHDAVAAEYPSSMQDTIDEIAATLDDALAGLEYLSADYSEVENTWNYFQTHYIQANYTPESWAAVVNYYNSIIWNISLNGQVTVNGYNTELQRLISLLVLKGADYKAVDNALKAIPDNDGGQITVDWNYLYNFYTSASVDNLKNAANAVVRGISINNQSIVDNYAAAIIAATHALVPLSADYSYLGIAIANTPAYPQTYYTDASWTTYNNAMASGNVLYNNQNLNKTQQYIIDNATAQINSAYAALTLKSVTYTVKYQTAGGTTLLTQAVKNATAADWITENAPAITGYTPTQTTKQMQMTGTSASNVIIFTYSANNYTITFNSNGGSTVTTITQNYNTSVAKPTDPTKSTLFGDQYHFDGWYSDYGLTAAVTWPYTMGASNVSFYAKWTQTVFTVTFSPGYGGDIPAPVTRTFTPGVDLMHLAPFFSRTGYTQTGWSPAIPAVSAAQSYYFTAQWAVNSYTITFNANGGIGSMQNQTITSGYSASLTSNTFTKTGYTFQGWATSAGGPVVYNNGANYTMGSSNVTLYAQWESITYAVMYDNNGSSGSMNVSFFTYDFAQNLTVNSYTRTGYTFAGWATTPGGTAVYYDGQSVKNLSTTNGATVTLYAKWTVNIVYITWNPNGGKWWDGSTESKTTTTSYCPGYVTRTGYTFIGWSPAVPSTMPAVSTTTYAQWSQNSYIITFDANGGIGGGSYERYPGDSLIPPTVTRTGYTFTGWAPFVPATVPANDATYTAQWAVNSYTLTFDANGGTGGTSGPMTSGTALSAPVVSKPGYVFTGWSPTVPSTVPAANTTYTAQFIKTAVSLTKLQDGLKVNIQGWVDGYKYQIWSYQKITSDIFSNGTDSQWVLSKAYTLGSSSDAIHESDGSISFIIAGFTSPDSNYTVAVRIEDTGNKFVSEIRDSYTPADVQEVKITKVLVDGNYAEGQVIKEISNSPIVFTVIGNGVSNTAFAAKVLETGTPIAASNTINFSWDTSALTPGIYTVRFTAGNGTTSDTKDIKVQLYSLNTNIKYGSISGLGLPVISDNLLPKTIAISPSFANGSFYYKVSEPGREPIFTSGLVAPSDNIQYTFTKYGIYRIQGYVNREFDVMIGGNYDDGYFKMLTVSRSQTGTTSATLASNVNIANPVNKGTPIVFTANASIAGIGQTPVQYSFWRYDAKGYALVKDWSSDNTLNWTPARVGVYTIEVRAKGADAGSYEVTKSVKVTVTDTVDQTAQGVVISINESELNATAQARVPITIKADATSTNMEGLLYKFNVGDEAMGIATLQDYSANQECVWTPRKAGTYTISVLVKSGASFGAYDAVKTFTVTVN